MGLVVLEVEHLIGCLAETAAVGLAVCRIHPEHQMSHSQLHCLLLFPTQLLCWLLQEWVEAKMEDKISNTKSLLFVDTLFGTPVVNRHLQQGLLPVDRKLHSHHSLQGSLDTIHTVIKVTFCLCILQVKMSQFYKAECLP